MKPKKPDAAEPTPDLDFRDESRGSPDEARAQDRRTDLDRAREIVGICHNAFVGGCGATQRRCDPCVTRDAIASALAAARAEGRIEGAKDDHAAVVVILERAKRAHTAQANRWADCNNETDGSKERSIVRVLHGIIEEVRALDPATVVSERRDRDESRGGSGK